MRFIILIIIILLHSTTLKAVDTKAEKAIVIDFNTNEILFEKNADKKIQPASMTKIMTVYAAFDRIKNTDLSIDQICIVSPRAYQKEGSTTYLEIDDKISIKDLLKGIIIQSGNDASLALAECLAGTEQDFVKLMNFYSNKLSMLNTNFINSHGLPEENHYSTVYDIAILSNSLIKDFPNLYKFFNETEFSYNEISQRNRNYLLNNVEGADGLKTGFTKKSGWSIAGSALRQDRRITVVLSGTNSKKTRLYESSNLINWAFSQTSQKKLLTSGQVIKNIDVWLGNKSTINLIVKNNIISTLSFDQLQLIKTSISYNKIVSAPIKKGQVLGEMNIIIPGKKNIIVPLIAESNVNEINPLFKIFAAIKYLIFGTSLDEI